MLAAVVRRVAHTLRLQPAGRVVPRPTPAAAQLPVEPAPRVYRLPAPDPETGSDADDDAHEVLEHEDGVVRPYQRLLAARTVVTALPQRSVVLLVEQTGDDDGGWHRVEHREDADTDHQLLQRVRLTAALEPTRQDTSTARRRNGGS